MWIRECECLPGCIHALCVPHKVKGFVTRFISSLLFLFAWHKFKIYNNNIIKSINLTEVSARSLHWLCLKLLPRQDNATATAASLLVCASVCVRACVDVWYHKHASDKRKHQRCHCHSRRRRCRRPPSATMRVITPRGILLAPLKAHFTLPSASECV